MFAKKRLNSDEEQEGITNREQSNGGVLIDFEIDDNHSGRRLFRKRTNLEHESFGSKKHRLRKTLKLIGLLIIVVIGYASFRVFSTTFAVIERSGKPDALALQKSITPNQLKKEGDGRVNILLIGVGGEGHQAGNLSDVNHVLSIDPFNNKVSILGIPRDLYVPIPGFYSTRINAAHAFGEQDGSGGPQLVEKTIEKNLGIPIHYYARVDFTGFEQAIDAVDGVDVTIKENLYDSHYPTRNMKGVEVFQLKAGKHHLDGETALKVVRCRKGTCGDDFGRGDRQQLVMEALKDKALSTGTVSSPSKVSKLLDAAGNHARTDMNLTVMMKLITIAERLQDKKIKPKNFVLSTDEGNYLTGKNVGGASVLVPTAGVGNFSQIQNFLRGELFRDGFLAKENASITVLNGTLTTGLATSAGANLTSYGYNVETIGDYVDKSQSKTKIYKLSDKKSPFTRALLKKRLNANLSHDSLPATVEVKTDYVVIIGTDYKIR